MHSGYQNLVRKWQILYFYTHNLRGRIGYLNFIGYSKVTNVIYLNEKYVNEHNYIGIFVIN